jgi:predicted SprT family Zn-dependent metalloprotease
MDLPLNIKNLIAKAQTEVAKVNPSWGAVVNTIKWEINSRMRRVLGRALMNRDKQTFKIELSREYITKGNEEAIYNTITHEIAHIIAFKVYNEKGHGMWWKMVHEKLGGDSKRLAKQEETGYTVKRNRVKRVVLEKNGKEYYVKVNRYVGYEAYYLAYNYLRTVIIEPDGKETPILTKEVGVSSFNLPVLKAAQAT